MKPDFAQHRRNCEYAGVRHFTRAQFNSLFHSYSEHAAEVRRGDAGFPVERVVGGERQRATTPHERLEGNSPLGVTPPRRTESHHGNDGSMVVTPNPTGQPPARLGAGSVGPGCSRKDSGGINHV
jgi:hypothetical protein